MLLTAGACQAPDRLTPEEELHFVKECVEIGGETWVDGAGKIHCKSAVTEVA